jgi:hypothetical protein
VGLEIFPFMPGLVSVEGGGSNVVRWISTGWFCSGGFSQGNVVAMKTRLGPQFLCTFLFTLTIR